MGQLMYRSRVNEIHEVVDAQRRQVRVAQLHWCAQRDLAQLVTDPEAEDGPGIYAIWGWHPVTGPNTMMYIGMSEVSVLDRLRTHLEDNVHEQAPPKAHYALFDGSVAREDILAVEALLIGWHFPPYNTQVSSGVSAHRGEWRVYNTGFYAGLFPIVCTGWWPRHDRARRGLVTPKFAGKPSTNLEVVGVDGCKAGWVAVRLVDGMYEDGSVFATFGELLTAYPNAKTIAVDIPIGLPPPFPRAADVAARKLLGSRGSSVFQIPLRAALEQSSHAEATAFHVAQTGKGISQQAYALRTKVLEVAAHADPRVFEVHPEVCFAAMAGEPLAEKKKTWNGQRRRQLLLEAEGIVVGADLVFGAVPADDVLDAAAAAWTAMRITAGVARSLPDPPAVGEDGYPAAIWY